MQISIVKLIFLLPSDLISGGGKSLGRIALVALPPPPGRRLGFECSQMKVISEIPTLLQRLVMLETSEPQLWLLSISKQKNNFMYPNCGKEIYNFQVITARALSKLFDFIHSLSKAVFDTIFNTTPNILTIPHFRKTSGFNISKRKF